MIISNCVINLAADKAPVLHEAYRVLKPGGRFAVSDIVIHGGLPAHLVDSDEMRRDLSSWGRCVAGALTDGEYRDLLATAGFRTLTWRSRGAIRQVTSATLRRPGRRASASRQTNAIVSRFASTFVRARK